MSKPEASHKLRKKTFPFDSDINKNYGYLDTKKGRLLIIIVDRKGNNILERECTEEETEDFKRWVKSVL